MSMLSHGVFSLIVGFEWPANVGSSFYGFPSHYYKEKYPNVGSREVANKVLDALSQAGIKGEGVKRGLDHGVWASFKCGMFESDWTMVWLGNADFYSL